MIINCDLSKLNMSQFKHIVYLLFFWISFVYNSEAGPAPRVVGGSPAEIGSAPYHASLRSLSDSHVCGGVIISRRAILSAAHCFNGDVLPEFVIAVLGTYKTSEPGDRYNLSQIIVHEKYNATSKENDIALVFTSINIVYTNRVRPIALLPRYVESGDLLFTGYGDITNSGTAAQELMQIDLNVLPLDTCKRAYASVLSREIFESQICTYNGFNEGVCKGDSGSPLVMKSTLVGIASFGVPCAVGMPDVFTRTSDYIGWIMTKIIITNII